MSPTQDSLKAPSPMHGIPEPIDIYDYFVGDCLRELAKVPLERQLEEIYPLKTVLLDYCGMASKYHWMFKNCDIYLLEESENVCDVVSRYEVVYALVYELQPVFLAFPCIKIVCFKNRICRTEFSGDESK